MPPTEAATEHALRAVALANARSSAPHEALRTAFDDDQSTYHLAAVSANTHGALQRKQLVHTGMDTLTDLGRLSRNTTATVDHVHIGLAEDHIRPEAGVHGVVPGAGTDVVVVGSTSTTSSSPRVSVTMNRSGH